MLAPIGSRGAVESRALTNRVEELCLLRTEGAALTRDRRIARCRSGPNARDLTDRSSRELDVIHVVVANEIGADAARDDRWVALVPDRLRQTRDASRPHIDEIQVTLVGRDLQTPVSRVAAIGEQRTCRIDLCFAQLFRSCAGCRTHPIRLGGLAPLL